MQLNLRLLEKNKKYSINSKLAGAAEPPLGYERKKISYSRFEKYEQCPKMFWYKYVLNILPKNQKSPTLYKGNFFHNIVDDSAKRKMNGQHDTLEQLKKIAKSKSAMSMARKFMEISTSVSDEKKEMAEQLIAEIQQKLDEGNGTRAFSLSEKLNKLFN